MERLLFSLGYLNYSSNAGILVTVFINKDIKHGYWTYYILMNFSFYYYIGFVLNYLV